MGYTVKDYQDAAKRAMDAGEIETAKSLIAKGMALQNAPTSVLEQAGNGTNEGLATALGAPVDLVTGGLNYGIQGANWLFGSDVQPIKDPVGGSASIQGMLDPFITDAQPQTAAQRYARRIGQEVGAGVPSALAMGALPAMGLAGRAAFPTYMATNAASDVGAGIGGQTSQELAPGNATADTISSIIGALVGGGAAVGLTKPFAQSQTLAELKAKAGNLWNGVQANTATLSDAATVQMQGDLRSVLPNSQLAPQAYPNAFRMADTVDTLKNPTIYDVEQARRIVGDAVAGDPKEARIGVGMKNSLSDFLGGLHPSDVTGNVDGVVDDLAAARNASARAYRAEEVMNQGQRAESRTGGSGVSGNQVNADRQTLRTILDRERDLVTKGARAGYTKDEIAILEKIVMGTPGTNLARRIGKLAPSSGTLPLMSSIFTGPVGAGAAYATGNPIYASTLAIPAIGEAAKGLATTMTQRQIAQLLATILNGGPLEQSAARGAAKAGLASSLAAITAR